MSAPAVAYGAGRREVPSRQLPMPPALPVAPSMPLPPAFTPDGGTCTGADSEVCLSCGEAPRIILAVPCSRGCCDLALCLDCASSQGYEIS